MNIYQLSELQLWKIMVRSTLPVPILSCVTYRPHRITWFCLTNYTILVVELLPQSGAKHRSQISTLAQTWYTNTWYVTSYTPGHHEWIWMKTSPGITNHLLVDYKLHIDGFVSSISLTHRGLVTHICVSNLTIIGSDNGLSPGRRQAVFWSNDGILLNGTIGTIFSELLIKILIFLFKKVHLKVSSAKWRPFCLGLSVLIPQLLMT